MAWSIIRRLRDEDETRLNEMAKRFLERHSELQPLLTISEKSELIWTRIDTAVDEYCIIQGDGYLRKLWLGCFRRAVGEPSATGICRGYIGFSVK